MLKADVVGLRLIAMLEALKGIVVVVVGVGLFSFLRHDVQRIGAKLVHHMHLDPARQYPQVFLDALESLNNVHLWMLAGTAAAYAGIRFAEAWGLWYGRAWAEWLAAVSGSIYIPFEIYGLSREVTTLRVIMFVCNVLIVAVMVHALRKRRAESQTAEG